MPATEAVPFYGEASLSQCITEALRSDMRKNIVLYAVALKDRQTLALPHQRTPDRLSQQVPG